MKRILTLVIIPLVMFYGGAGVGFSQQTTNPTGSKGQSTPNSHAVKIRHQLEFIGLGQDVTVKLQHGNDYHGRLVITEDSDFKIDEVDLRRVISINYDDVKRIDRGYMQKSLIGGKRSNPHTSKTIMFAALSGLAVILIVVGAKSTR